MTSQKQTDGQEDSNIPLKLHLWGYNNKMLSLMIHAGMKAASIAEKYITRVSGICKFFSAMLPTFVNHQRKHFITYLNKKKNQISDSDK